MGILANTVNYDLVSRSYADYREPDPRIAKILNEAIGDAGSVLNIGAGTGSYEPTSKCLVAVDASRGMISRRQSTSPAVQAQAESLPFADKSFDVALAILTIHHWQDFAQGLREARRVARSRVVLLTWVGFPDGFWLTDYVPEVGEVDRHLFPSLRQLAKILGPLEARPVEIPRDCTDGFQCAYWARPEQYLDAGVRSAISTFDRIPEPAAGLTRLADDIRSGRWHDQNSELLELQNKDYGYRVVVADLVNL